MPYTGGDESVTPFDMETVWVAFSAVGLPSRISLLDNFSEAEMNHQANGADLSAGQRGHPVAGHQPYISAKFYGAGDSDSMRGYLTALSNSGRQLADVRRVFSRNVQNNWLNEVE